MSSAAIFDLDRTLLAGGSGPAFQRAFRQAGLGPDRDIPLVDALFGLFNLIGETYPSMLLTRRAASLSSGWPVAEVVAAATQAAAELAEEIQPHGRVLIEDHKAAGRTVVLATTTPEHLVRPLAERIGADEVVATRYGIDGDRFDGTIDGEFVWGRGKYRAVKAWAEAARVNLEHSYAYSDSYYDIPLLSRVGHPTAVNPDARLAGVAYLRGWPVRWLDAPAGVPKIAGLVEPQKVTLPLARAEFSPLADIEISGDEHLPRDGAAIVVFNHRSYFDSSAMAALFAKVGRPARFLGKKEVFDAPVIGQIATWMGGIRVDRGTGSDAPLMAAADALRAGEMIAMAPQGTIPRGPAFFEPVLKARWGAARLAAMSGAQIVPVGLWGTEKVWPRNQRLPDLNPLSRPEVSVTVGRPFRIAGNDPDADTTEIMARIVDLLPPEARERREPSDEELMATFPPGYDGDPRAEYDRRPGTDT